MNRRHLWLPVLILSLGAVAGCPRSSEPGNRQRQTPPSATDLPAAAALDVALGRSEPVPDPVYPQHGNPAVDVLLYDLELTWAPETTQLTGLATLTVRAAKPTDEIRLDFSGSLSIDSVAVDGTPVDSTGAGDDLFVPVGRELAVDDQVVLRVSYAGIPRPVEAPMVRNDINQVGLVVMPGGNAFALQEPFGAFTWYPVNDHPSDEALYDISITVPDGWAGVSSGTPVRPKRTPADGTTFRYVSDDPVASYLVALGLDRYQHTVTTGPHGLPLHFWYRAEERETVLSQTAKVPEMIGWLEERYGPYPFDTAGMQTIPIFTGMETQTMITLVGGAPDGVLVHELAHQWFGNAVTPRDWLGMWLNEGWAMYTQALWEDQHQDPAADAKPMADSLARFRDRDAGLRAQHGPPGNYNPGHFGSANVYYSPALMLHEIRVEVGNEEFFALARDWVQTNLDTSQDRASFTAFVNQHTGRDFTALIDIWLDSPTTPA